MKKRVVIVEDFSTSRQIIKKTLESLDFTVEEAADGRDALRFFDGRNIDLVVTDFNMPNMNGADLVTYIRSKENYKYIPIFMLSTETNIEKQLLARAAKITSWIKKPFEISDFKKLIQKAVFQ